MKLGDIFQIHRSFLSVLRTRFATAENRNEERLTAKVNEPVFLQSRTFWYSALKRVQGGDACSRPAPSVYPRTMGPCRVYSIALDFLWLSHRERVVEL